ncbi:unnamed protein product [Citrullus colocynthis]|uniref:Uncharacterized protein n=1 Tax=Citrullus colocynthis TaxID=252529 RepID=A0ABP0Z313_9ROSI
MGNYPSPSITSINYGYAPLLGFPQHFSPNYPHLFVAAPLPTFFGPYTTMDTQTSYVHQRLLLTCAGGFSATLLTLVALAELIASSQFMDSNKMNGIDASNNKRKSKSRKCQTTKPIDGEENENENNDSDNELGEDQEVLENGEEGKNAPTKDGANGGEDASNDNGNDGSEHSGEGGDDDEEDNDDGGSDENNEDNNEDEEDVDEEDIEEDNFEEDDDEETLPPPKKRKK